MEQSIFTYKETYTVRSYETDFNSCASIQTIVNYLQNSGFNHALELRKAGGLSPDPRVAYFLTRQKVRVIRYPKWQETVTLVTWLDTRIDKYAVREFEILDKEGNIIVCATNSALFYDLNEKKVIPASEQMKKIPHPSRGRALDDPFDPVPRPSKADYRAEFTARTADIDMYKHVNNVVYVEWAVETLPHQLWEGWALRDHEINFKSETPYGETVISEAEEVPDGDMRIFVHRLSAKSDGKEIALLRTWWGKK